MLIVSAETTWLGKLFQIGITRLKVTCLKVDSDGRKAHLNVRVTVRINNKGRVIPSDDVCLLWCHSDSTTAVLLSMSEWHPADSSVCPRSAAFFKAAVSTVLSSPDTQHYNTCYGNITISLLYYFFFICTAPLYLQSPRRSTNPIITIIYVALIHPIQPTVCLRQNGSKL